LPIDLSAFAHHNPDVKVIVQERWSEEIVRALQAAEADVGIVSRESLLRDWRRALIVRIAWPS